MIAVSRRWKAHVRYVPRWLTRVEWTSDGSTWTEAKATACTVSEDSTSQVRWSASATLLDVPVDPRGGLWAYGSWFRVSVGLEYAPGDVEWIRKGTYRVDEIGRSAFSRGVEITGSSWEQQLIDARYLTPETLPASTAEVMLERLVRSALPDVPIVWDGSLPKGTRLPKRTVLRDRWEAIDGPADAPSIARAMGARVHADHMGNLVVTPVPSLEDPAVWEASAGPGGVLLGATETLSRERVRNAVAASGGSTDQDTPAVGPGIALDTDPLSPTYAYKSVSDGGFGIVPLFYVSDMLTTLRQCEQTARALLAPRLGLRQEIGFDHLYDPSLQAGDVGIIADAPGGPQRVLIDSIELDTIAATMSASTRVTATTLAGDAVTVADEGEEGEGESIE